MLFLTSVLCFAGVFGNETWLCVSSIKLLFYLNAARDAADILLDQRKALTHLSVINLIIHARSSMSMRAFQKPCRSPPR